MLIDCDRCPVRGQACAGCVVSVLFDEVPAPPAPPVDDEVLERRALQVLADAGFEVTVLAREDRRLRVAGGRRRRSAA